MQELLDDLYKQIDAKVNGPKSYRFDLELMRMDEDPSVIRRALLQHLKNRGYAGHITFLIRGNKKSYIIQVFAKPVYQPTDEGEFV